MNGFLLAACAAAGVHLLVAPAPRPRRTIRRHLAAARTWQVPVLAGFVALGAGAAAFGPSPAAAVVAVCAAWVPVATRNAAAGRRRAAGQAAWPQMIEELRILTGSVGRSVPQALLEVGQRSPEVLRPAFAMAQREWSLDRKSVV